MPTLLQRGISAFANRMKAAAGREVVYRQRNQTPVTLTAWMAMNGAEIFGDDNLVTKSTWVEWSLAAADLGAIVPKVGDRIVDGDKTYEVLPTQDRLGSHPASERMDSGSEAAVLLTVRTKLVVDDG